MTKTIEASDFKSWLSDGDELALLDVREFGQYGEGHLFFAISVPYSRLELDLPLLVPNPRVRLVLCDDADGVGERAAERAKASGYENVYVLSGGIRAWEAAGYTLYAGVNVPSKSFGELVEHACDTPRISAEKLQALRDGHENFVLVDGRTYAEYEKMNVPGGISCPNGELALRIAEIAPDPETQIVVNCAGRTRSIIGAQTLIDLGVPNPVVALENGTQGWFLAGLELEHGASRRYPDELTQADLSSLRERTHALAEARGATFVAPAQVSAWKGERDRTTYIFDIRTAEEFASNGARASVHAPGGQLIQATDHWVGVKNARLVLVDSEGVRAAMVASWLRQLGHEAFILEGGVAALADMNLPAIHTGEGETELKHVSADELAGLVRDNAVSLVDVRPSMSYRDAHIEGAHWSIRPRAGSLTLPKDRPVVLVGDNPVIAALAAGELSDAGIDVAGLLKGSKEDWKQAGLTIVSTPDEPANDVCIDFLYFTHGRHDGNEAASRQYLAWEVGLVDQLDEQERGVFRIVPASR